jgi:hypothetical protein
MLVVSTRQPIAGAQRARPVGGRVRSTVGWRRRDRDSSASHAVRTATRSGVNRLRAVRAASSRPLQGVFFGTPGATAPREATTWHRNPRDGAGVVVGPGVRARCLRRRAGPSVTTVENLAARRGVEGVVNATAVATTVATGGGAPREKPGGYGWAWRTRPVGEHAASCRRRARRSARGGRRGTTPHGVVAGIRARAQRVRGDSRGGRCEETPMRSRSDRRSTQRCLARVSTASIEPGALESHAWPGAGCLVDARAKPARASRGRLRRPLSARALGARICRGAAASRLRACGVMIVFAER